MLYHTDIPSMFLGVGLLGFPYFLKFPMSPLPLHKISADTTVMASSHLKSKTLHNFFKLYEL